MEILENNINNLKNKRLNELNMENFYTPADEDRYFNYLYNYVLSSVTDDGVVFDHIKEEKFYTKERVTGVTDIYGSITCIVPERETLFDEMVCIHEISHLISILNSPNNDKSKYREVIPYFNEYEYLRQIHSFFSSYYETYRENDAIIRARALDDQVSDKRRKRNESFILAYELLKKRKRNYNITSLNRINAKTLTLEKDLKRKGYKL